ncbi:hypothetical protein V0U79_05385 [Hyphobacterium sp. HN65]|uniref:DUF1579 domain-containing protein n=1 Tax=Hyphobacterium lacteum TaxID=3116575 RepID=A0ABU7LPD9_9PROT|nr:hypothetical protein [Hyphobacterium sp. HN65]MEE2525791.1 hypothetical protein [Hyphobacterium sp. HN65]
MKNRFLKVLAVLAAGSSLSAGASAQSNTAPQSSPCSGEEFRQLDFWVGDWHAEWDNGDGTTGFGENLITRDEYGDCVIYERFSTENFAGAPFRGMSVSTYHAPVGAWRQSWVDDSGGYFALVGGPGGENDDYDFMVENTRIVDSAPYRRMIWQDVTPDSFTWRWQGRASEDEAWADLWVILYTRADRE